MNKMKIEIRVYGTPAPGGSKKAFVIRGTNRAIVTEDCKRSKPWRETVKSACLEAYSKLTAEEKAQLPFRDVPVSIQVEFVMPRPGYHFGKKGLKSSAPRMHTKKPDATKLMRSTEDAIIDSRFFVADDSLFYSQTIVKLYEDQSLQPGAIIRIEELA